MEKQQTSQIRTKETDFKQEYPKRKYKYLSEEIEGRKSIISRLLQVEMSRIYFLNISFFAKFLNFGPWTHWTRFGRVFGSIPMITNSFIICVQCVYMRLKHGRTLFKSILRPKSIILQCYWIVRKSVFFMLILIFQQNRPFLSRLPLIFKDLFIFYVLLPIQPTLLSSFKATIAFVLRRLPSVIVVSLIIFVLHFLLVKSFTSTVLLLIGLINGLNKRLSFLNLALNSWNDNILFPNSSKNNLPNLDLLVNIKLLVLFIIKWVLPNHNFLKNVVTWLLVLQTLAKQLLLVMFSSKIIQFISKIQQLLHSIIMIFNLPASLMISIVILLFFRFLRLLLMSSLLELTSSMAPSLFSFRLLSSLHNIISSSWPMINNFVILCVLDSTSGLLAQNTHSSNFDLNSHIIFYLFKHF